MRTSLTVLMLAAAGTQAQIYYVENFDAGVNSGAWTCGAATQVIEPSGGFWGGAYFRAAGLNIAIPLIGTGNTTSVFTGNYRAASITTVAAALRVHESATPVNSMHPAAMLVSFNGTPEDASDDWGAYAVHPDPLAGIGTWRYFSFMVHSNQLTLPAGWSFIQLGPSAPAPNWNTLCQQVDRLAFTYVDPAATHAIQAWEVGADYIFITSRPNCYPNCDDSTTMPCLNILDFTCFLNRFASGDTRANCDNSTVVPVLNVQDFGCFLMSYAASCNSC